MTELAAKRVALITGASTGIGLATARKMLEKGMFVVLTARESSLSRFNRADFLHHDPSTYWLRPLDVTSAIQRRELIAEIDHRLGRLDVLVNNAGVIYRTPLEYAYDFECKEQMQVNFHAPLELIKVCLPMMRRQASGHIINVSSAAGFFSVPTMGLYAASKHALEGASEALQHELKPWNIHLTLVEPGFVSSSHQTNLGLAFARHWRESDDYRIQSSTVSALIDHAIRLTTATPEKVADVIYHVSEMKRPPLRVQATLDAQVFYFLKRFLPSAAFEKLVAFCLKVIAREAEPQLVKKPPLGRGLGV